MTQPASQSPNAAYRIGTRGAQLRIMDRNTHKGLCLAERPLIPAGTARCCAGPTSSDIVFLQEVLGGQSSARQARTQIAGLCPDTNFSPIASAQRFSMAAQRGYFPKPSRQLPAVPNFRIRVSTILDVSIGRHRGTRQLHALLDSAGHRRSAAIACTWVLREKPSDPAIASARRLCLQPLPEAPV